MEDLIGQYGYAVIFLGTFLEGETIVLIAAYLSHVGYLKIEYTALAAFAGTFLGDQLYFVIGRKWGRAWLARKPAWQDRMERAFDLLERHETLFILSFRFIYGLRTVSPFAIGMSDVRAIKFVSLNFISAAIWSVALCAAGWFAGAAIHGLIGRIKTAEYYIVGAIALGGIVVWGIFLYRRRLRIKRPPPPE